jgi:uncharacterized protein
MLFEAPPSSAYEKNIILLLCERRMIGVDDKTARWLPTNQVERHRTLDVLRGLALFGVLHVNLLSVFRVPLYRHILGVEPDASPSDRIVETLTSLLIEFKAFALFSFLFGVGIALQAQRALSRGVNGRVFLFRRFGVLLLFGICHMLLIWNGDILALYGICGLLLIPITALERRTLLISGFAPIALSHVIPLAPGPPPSSEWPEYIANATRVYGSGSYEEILRFRWFETPRWILPLLVASAPGTLGVMMLGMSAWRSGVLRRPEEHTRLLQTVLIVCALAGLAGTVLGVTVPVPVAFAYGAALFLWMARPNAPRLGALAAAGQMALTNYLMQSILFGFVFYGYGLGMSGRLGSAVTALIGVVVYAAQMMCTTWWLARFPFGPFEWLWRRLTYGRNLSSIST